MIAVLRPLAQWFFARRCGEAGFTARRSRARGLGLACFFGAAAVADALA